MRNCLAMFFASSSKNLFRFTQFFRFCELMREIILTSSPVGVFYAIFRLTDFSSDPFDFLSENEINRQHSAQPVLETYTYGVKGGS